MSNSNCSRKKQLLFANQHMCVRVSKHFFIFVNKNRKTNDCLSVFLFACLLSHVLIIASRCFLSSLLCVFAHNFNCTHSTDCVRYYLWNDSKTRSFNSHWPYYWIRARWKGTYFLVWIHDFQLVNYSSRKLQNHLSRIWGWATRCGIENAMVQVQRLSLRRKKRSNSWNN